MEKLTQQMGKLFQRISQASLVGTVCVCACTVCVYGHMELAELQWDNSWFKKDSKKTVEKSADHSVCMLRKYEV